MDKETINLIVVGAYTLAAGLLGAVVQALVTYRNGRAERMEDRFIWKREKLIELVIGLLDLSREVQSMPDESLDRSRVADLTSRIHRASEHVLLLDSGMVAMAGTNLAQAEMNRLTAITSALAGQTQSRELMEELDRKCIEGRAALVAAMRIVLGDPTASRDMRRNAAKATKKFRKRS